MEAKDKIVEQINKILQKTIDRKIPWKFSNANIVRWVRQDNDRLFTVTVQSQMLPAPIQNRQTNFTLTIQATNPNEIVLQINSATLGEQKEILNKLFVEAMKISQESSSDVIDKLLGDL